MIEQIINNYPPEGYVDNQRLFSEQQVKEMLRNYKDLLINNWQKNE